MADDKRPKTQREKDADPAEPQSGRTPDAPAHGAKPELKRAEERGERLDTGKAIARGGKESGRVPGAEPADEK